MSIGLCVNERGYVLAAPYVGRESCFNVLESCGSDCGWCPREAVLCVNFCELFAALGFGLTVSRVSASEVMCRWHRTLCESSVIVLWLDNVEGLFKMFQGVFAVLVNAAVFVSSIF